MPKPSTQIGFAQAPYRPGVLVVQSRPRMICPHCQTKGDILDGRDRRGSGLRSHLGGSNGGRDLGTCREHLLEVGSVAQPTGPLVFANRRGHLHSVGLGERRTVLLLRLQVLRVGAPGVEGVQRVEASDDHAVT